MGSMRGNQHIGRLDDGAHLFAGLEAEVVDRLVGDRRRDVLAVADVDDDMRGGRPLGDLEHLAGQHIAG